MSLPFPADSAEYEEYCAAMERMADEAEASVRDPQPEDFGPEDRYLDSSWEDAAEMACGFDF